MKRKPKYLFFDIECSNGYNICSFGYVLISEDMRVIRKKDIIINPENRFILAPKGQRPKIELAYPQEIFYKQDNFTAYYDEIKQLLVDSKLTLIGHSIQSDFYFLNYACLRYKFPVFELQGYDTQKMYKKLYNADHVESLEKIIDHLQIENDITFHRSCDDALASFYIAREMCFENNCSMEELLGQCDDCLVLSPEAKNIKIK